jgi:hypothetical protein
VKSFEVVANTANKIFVQLKDNAENIVNATNDILSKGTTAILLMILFSVITVSACCSIAQYFINLVKKTDPL